MTGLDGNGKDRGDAKREKRRMNAISWSVKRELPVIREVDVLICGGGPGGLGGAVFAARAGAKVALIERYGAPGGMAFYGEVHPFMPSHADGLPLDRPVYGEWIERMLSYLPPSLARACTGKADGFERMIDKDAASLAAEDLLLQAGVELLYHHAAVDVIRDGRRIAAVVAEAKGGPVALAAKTFVDATGDGDIAAFAGNEFEYGGPAGDAQPMTLCFKLSGIDFSGTDSASVRRELDRAYQAAKRDGRIDCPREDVLMFGTRNPGVIHFNTTRIVKRNGVDGRDLAAAEREGRRQLRALLALFRSASPAFREARLHSMAGHVGVRETRRILGRAYATRRWFEEARKEPDAVLRCSYPIDIHNPGGAGTELVRLNPGDWYEIPYGCVVARDLDNLAVGCRAVSVDHALHSSLRVMPPVVSLGQAAGLAAAWGALRGCPLGGLDGREVREGLAAMGAFL